MKSNLQDTMWYRMAAVLAVIGSASMMSLRSELSSIAARTVTAAIAGSLGAIAWICLAKSRTGRTPREQS